MSHSDAPRVLASLAQREILAVTGVSGVPIYVFRSPVVLDVAYEMLDETGLNPQIVAAAPLTAHERRRRRWLEAQQDIPS